MPQSSLPYSSRPLTKKELSKEDVYVFHSPKHDDTTTLIGVPRLAFFLEQEFDPSISACVPRPRRLQLHASREIEIDFWTQSLDHQESFWVLLQADEVLHTSAGPVPKEQRLWDHAAIQAGLNLKFIFEHELQRHGGRTGNYVRMLPHVQAAMRLRERDFIMGRIREMFGPGIATLSFNQILASLADYPAAQVLMAACALIHRGWLHFDSAIDVSLATRLHPRSDA